MEKLDYYWPADYYDFSDPEYFDSLDDHDKHKVLTKLSDKMLTEAYFIEKAGIVFGAKMLLLAESEDERELYARTINEECNHLDIIRTFLGDREYKSIEIFEFIKRTIETGNKDYLVYCVQILLEGYGIMHYKKLASYCLSADLKLGLETILKDEYLHYGSGKILFDKKSPNSKQLKSINDFQRQFEAIITKEQTPCAKDILNGPN